ncbi:C40 family peptidase [Nereida sp. MMG025]|uniref:C40 family peptidase n=1 Tax=Nereida sp. MMG025 TaxID=2909981 RepID=UPI001F230D92|nr:NlpC/P60 family protein [Nereida sp. MMG025]MCF6444464.1 C40 family peptidase [Nereida sp. MMG025]
MTDARISPVHATQPAGAPRRVMVPVADLLRAADGPRDRQLQMGESVTPYQTVQGMTYVQAQKDGYCGFVRSDVLEDAAAPTHMVASRATHAYGLEDFKSREVMSLGFGAKLTVLDERKAFYETPQGFVPKKHLRPLNKPFSDPATVAQLHFGTPYLWGGNSVFGIDCSGLVQAALVACDISCPGDSDLQEGQLGVALSQEAALQRGDVMFWKGHVGMMVDAETLIHANAHHMAVSYEPIANAIVRIEAQGGGAVTARKRLG